MIEEILAQLLKEKEIIYLPIGEEIDLLEKLNELLND